MSAAQPQCAFARELLRLFPYHCGLQRGERCVDGYLLLLAAISIGGYFLWKGGRRGETIRSTEAAAVTPSTVTISDEDDTELRRRRKRTGENQELRRRTVHGPYQPIGDRGAPTTVRTGES